MDPPNNLTRIGLTQVMDAKWIILKTVFRQSDDQQSFKTALEHVGAGSVTCTAWQLLMSRRVALHQRTYNDLFRNHVHLFTTNSEIEAHNTKCLDSNRMPVAKINAVHNNSTALQGSEMFSQGLVRTLFLSIESKVMLRRNLCVSRGSVNGSQTNYMRKRTVAAFAPALYFGAVRKVRRPILIDRLTPIMPVISQWRDSGVECTRTLEQYAIYFDC